MTIIQQLYYRFLQRIYLLICLASVTIRDLNLRSCIVGAGAGCLCSNALSIWLLWQASILDDDVDGAPIRSQR